MTTLLDAAGTFADVHPTGLVRPPRYYTARSPHLRTRGPHVAAIARGLGRPLIPWQRYVADVVNEMNPPGSHFLWRYQIVIILVPRQAGKTTLMRPILVDRCITRPRTSVVMSAQLGKDSSDRWEDLVADIEDGVFGRYVDVKRGKGDQKCLWPNRSKIEPFTPTKKGVHGKSPNAGLIDEAWAFPKEHMDEVLTALNPSMVTKRDRQLFIISAAGDATSTYLEEQMEIGRAATQDPNSTTAYFEWSADVDADPYDPQTWEYHPGLDGLITLDDLREESKPEKNTHANWLRSYLNRWTKATSTILDLDAWDALGADDLTPPRNPDDTPAFEQIAFGYDVAIDRTSAAVWAAWRDDDNVMNLAVYEYRPGADWLPEFLVSLHRDGALNIGADDGGPARIVTDQVRRAGVPVQTLPGRDAGTAWGSIKAAVKDSTKPKAPTRLRHDRSPALRTALEYAAEQRRGDIASLSRVGSLAPIDPAIAASTAAWFADRIDTSVPIF